MKKYEIALELVKKLESEGFIAYFAGGCVRDALMGSQPDDYDIATNASLSELERIFPHSHRVGAAFNILLVVQNKLAFEVASFRKDGPYINGRQPQSVSQATAKEDAMRRDFTVNGIFFHPLREEYLDYVGGKKDILQQKIQTIGNPLQRFEEDKLRLLRACRFAATLGFKIEAQTFEALCSLAHTLFPSVSIERVWAELFKAYKKGCLTQMLQLMGKTPLLKTVFSPFGLSSTFIQKNKAMLSSYQPPLPFAIYFSLLFPGLSEKQLENLFTFFKASNKDKHLALGYFKVRNFLQNHQMSDSLVPLLKLMKTLPLAIIFQIYKKEHPQDDVGDIEKKLSLFFKEGSFHPPLKALDLIERGYQEGKMLGILVDKAWNLALKQEEMDKNTLIKWLQDLQA